MITVKEARWIRENITEVLEYVGFEIFYSNHIKMKKSTNYKNDTERIEKWNTAAGFNNDVANPMYKLLKGLYCDPDSINEKALKAAKKAVVD